MFHINSLHLLPTNQLVRIPHRKPGRWKVAQVAVGEIVGIDKAGDDVAKAVDVLHTALFVINLRAENCE